MILEENGVEWIHTVWVVITIALLMEDCIDILKTVKKIVPLILGLLVGIVTGIVIQAMVSWGCPRWSILLLRVLCMTAISVACNFIFQRRIGQNLFRGRWSIQPIHISFVCFAAALPLFSTSSSLALARCVGVLFASALVLVVNSVFWTIRVYRERKDDNSGRIFHQNSDLIKNVLLLARICVRGLETDKEIVDTLLGDVRSGLKFFESAVITTTPKRSSSSRRRAADILNSHIRTLAYECSSTYWSLMSVSVTVFLHRDRHDSGEVAYFTDNINSHNQYFAGSLKMIHDGFIDLHRAMDELVSGSTVDEEIHRCLDRICIDVIGHKLMEGYQGLEFNFGQSSSYIFSSNTERSHMCSYIVNVGAVIVGVVDLVRVLVSFLGLPEDVESYAVRSLSQCTDKINAMQKTGTFNCLLTESSGHRDPPK
jgi:hypothetical protein